MAWLFETAAKISLDDSEFTKGIEKSKNSFADMGKKIATGAAVAGTAAAGALVAIGKASIDAYSNFEQLAGGTQLLFGDAFSAVMENAKSAYKNVQMSQNDYLKQVNGFATGLKTALDGNEQAAAELADRIVTAEADIVAATGNTQEAVQNAFNGIMRSNFTINFLMSAA